MENTVVNAVVDMKSKAQRKLRRIKTAIQAITLAALVTVTVPAQQAFAAGADGDAKSKSVVKSFFSVIFEKVMPIIGAGIFIFGGIKLVMAFRDDNNKQGLTDAIKDLAIGAVLLSFGLFFGDTLLSILNI